MKRMKPLALATIALVSMSLGIARSDEWPQWMGPQRDNIWREEGILDAFPASGPKLVWKAPLAWGYSGPAVAGGKVFISDYVSDANLKDGNFSRKAFNGTERVLCLNEADGKVLWKHEYPVTYAISYPSGPRVTPTVHEGKVYFLGGEGHLICFETETGKLVWQKDLKKEYKTNSALWGYASHPLIDGKKLICLVGGEGTHTVAFDKDTGAEIWRSQTSKEQGYSPPSIIKAGGVRQLIIPRPDAVASLDPETGKLLWSVPYDATNGSIIMTPIRKDEYLYVGGYSNKSLLLKLDNSKPGAEVVWQNKGQHGISPVNVQPFLEDGVLYGFDQKGDMFGVELPSGKRLFATPEPVSKRARGSETAFIVKNGSRFFFFTETGHLVIGNLSPTGFKETSRAKLVEPTNDAFGRDVVWCAPAFANKRIYVRNDKEMACYDLAK